MRIYRLLMLLLAVGICLGTPSFAKNINDCSAGYCHGGDVLVIIDDVDTITSVEFKRSFDKNRIGQAQTMSARDFLDEFLTFRLNVAEAKKACVDTLPEYRLAVATHMMTLVQPELPLHLSAMITSQNDDVVADIVAATDSVYNSRGDIRAAVEEYCDYLSADYVVEDYLEKAGMNNPDSLARFFEETWGDYVWDEPRFKGYVICLSHTENPGEAKDILMRAGEDISAAILMLRKAYGRNIRIGHVVMPRGVNEVVDYVAFDGDKTGEVDNWSLCKVVGGRLIYAPESFEDVRGPVTDRYRKQLLEHRFDRLRATHNVKINQKALKKIESLTDNSIVTSSAQNK